MAKFPVDAPKQKVIKALGFLGFQIVREREHISMLQENRDGSKISKYKPDPTGFASLLSVDYGPLTVDCIQVKEHRASYRLKGIIN